MVKNLAKNGGVSRAQFFSLVYRKGIEAGVDAVEKLVETYKEVGSNVAEKVEPKARSGQWIQIASKDEMSHLPKLFVKKGKGFFVLPDGDEKVRAFLANCPEDSLVLQFNSRTGKVFCPFCQKVFSKEDLLSGKGTLEEVKAKQSEDALLVGV